MPLIKETLKCQGVFFYYSNVNGQYVCTQSDSRGTSNNSAVLSSLRWRHCFSVTFQCPTRQHLSHVIGEKVTLVRLMMPRHILNVVVIFISFCFTFSR